MVKWLRSVGMEYISIIFQEDIGRKLLDEIGNLAAIQFTDLNYELTPFQRRYASYIKRCDEVERKLRYFEHEFQKHNIVAEPKDYEQFRKEIGLYQNESINKIINEIEDAIGSKEHELQQLNKILEIQSGEYNKRLSYYEIINNCSTVFANINEQIPLMKSMDGNIEEGKTDDPNFKFQYVCGVLPLAERSNIERLLYRSTRGHCYLQFFDFDQQLLDEKSGEPSKSKKLIFIVFSRYISIVNKIKKICIAHNAILFNINNLDDPNIIAKSKDESLVGINDSKIIFSTAYNNIIQLLNTLSLHYYSWLYKVQHEKLIFNVLNYCSVQGSGILRAEGWIKVKYLNAIKEIITTSQNEHLGMIEILNSEHLKPPTFIQTNKVTFVHQLITNTYGIPSYKEINPSVFNFITFPLMFGIMYGDMGHAFILLLFTLVLLIKEDYFMKNSMGEMFDMVFAGRYILLPMSLFAIYAGLMYNDCLGLSMNLFGSAYEIIENNGTFTAIKDPNSVYVFGVDPIWKAATNELTFVNSLKMKMAIIFGVLHMVIGVCIKITNNYLNRDKAEMFFVSLPQLLFLLLLFGYMSLIIIYKWCVDWSVRMARNEQVPELITILINLALSPGSVAHPLYNNQGKIQLILLIIAVICVPWMLLLQPIYLTFFKKKSPADLSPLANNVSDNPSLVLKDKHPHGVELFIHQGIETIEYVLGAISNTASYLRLWALSLAHSQLAAVFWQRIMMMILDMKNPFLIFLGYYLYAGATVFVLLMMDCLECFLHAIRLHWVEFQNKFYRGTGYLFQPLEFKKPK